MSHSFTTITQLLRSLSHEIEQLDVLYQGALTANQELTEEAASLRNKLLHGANRLNPPPAATPLRLNAQQYDEVTHPNNITIPDMPCMSLMTLTDESKKKADGNEDGFYFSEMDLPGTPMGSTALTSCRVDASSAEVSTFRPTPPFQEPAVLCPPTPEPIVSSTNFFKWNWGRREKEAEIRDSKGGKLSVSTNGSDNKKKLKRVRSAVGQFAEPKQLESTPADRKIFDRDAIWKCRGCFSLQDFVRSFWFDGVFSLLILFNSIVMAFEVQYNGLDNCLRANMPGCDRPAEEIWPGAGQAFYVLGWIFGLLFTLEVVLKIVVFRERFVMSAWNLFDFCVVSLWVAEKVLSSLVFDPTIIRLGRMARLARLARMARTIQTFDSLQVLLGSLAASGSALFWSSCLLFVLQMIMGLFFHNMLTDRLTDENTPLEARREIFNYFGTFSRSMISMFELTLANWPKICWVLVNEVSEWYGIVVLIYKVVVGFAVVIVVTGVFLHETFKVASSDDELMLVQKQRQTKSHVRKMERLFKEADTSCDGLIDREEFKNILTIDKVKTWLGAMELEVSDPDLLFDFLDDGDEAITVAELIDGVARLKGAARNIDVVALMRTVNGLYDIVEEIQNKVVPQSLPLSNAPSARPSLNAAHTAPIMGHVSSIGSARSSRQKSDGHSDGKKRPSWRADAVGIRPKRNSKNGA